MSNPSHTNHQLSIERKTSTRAFIVFEFSETVPRVRHSATDRIVSQVRNIRKGASSKHWKRQNRSDQLMLHRERVHVHFHTLERSCDLAFDSTLGFVEGSSQKIFCVPLSLKNFRISEKDKYLYGLWIILTIMHFFF